MLLSKFTKRITFFDTYKVRDYIIQNTAHCVGNIALLNSINNKRTSCLFACKKTILWTDKINVYSIALYAIKYIVISK